MAILIECFSISLDLKQSYQCLKENCTPNSWDLIWFFFIESNGEGLRSKFVQEHNQAAKNGTCEHLWGQWCHLAIMQGHANDSKCLWSAEISSYATFYHWLRPGEFKDHSAASNSWCLAPRTKYWPRLRHPICLAIFSCFFFKHLKWMYHEKYMLHKTWNFRPTIESQNWQPQKCPSGLFVTLEAFLSVFPA